MSIAEMLNQKDDNLANNIFYGVTVGIVTDIEDPEKLGRIKVKLINRDTSDYETDFIRIVTPMSGKQWGMFFFPEIGDEVLVAFGNGEIGRPYVIGSLWNQTYKPPVEIKDKKNIVRQIKTKNGHEIIFHDEQDKDFIQIKTPKQLSIELNDEKEVITIKDKEGKNLLKIDSKNGIVDILAEKNINIITGNSKIELDGSSNSIVMQSSKSIKLKSQQIVLEAQGSLELKAASMLNVKSDGQASIKGAVVKIN